MTGFPTVNFGESDQGLFSADEIQRLMQVEFERAVRYGYPYTLMLIEVDRLEYLHDLYGYQSKEEILQSVVTLLRSMTRASDVLGCMQDDRVMAVFPHLSTEAVGPLTSRLLRGCRELEFESDGRSLRATLSIGVSIATESEDPEFGLFVSTAAEALAYALEAGGDRYVIREAAASMIAGIRDELTLEATKLRAERPLAQQARRPEAPVPPPTPAPRIPSIEDLPKGPLRDRIRVLFQAIGEGSPELKKLEHEVLALAEKSLRDARAVEADAETQGKQIDTLERRIGKLKSLLDQAEVELHATARRKGVEEGVASIYRTVQGLSQGDGDFERKREALTLIFEANAKLQKGRPGQT